MLPREHAYLWTALALIGKFVRPLLLLSLLAGSLSVGLWLAMSPPSFAADAARPMAQNQADQLSLVPDRFFPRNDETWSVAWGDMDNDGDLDLAMGNENGPLLVYQNQAGVVAETPFWRSSMLYSARSVAWGDMDGNGYLDLAVGGFHYPLTVYLNDGGQLSERTWTATDIDYVRSIAWGDMNGDGRLELAAGISGTVKIYINQGSSLTPSPDSPLGVFGNRAFTSVAWGDADNDGQLDLALGTSGNNTVYFNDQGKFVETITNTWSYREPGVTRAVAWGDMDGDGKLDLAVGNVNGSSKVYRNLGKRVFDQTAWNTGNADSTVSIAWGDVDADGYLDLAVANAFNTGAEIQPIRIYRNLNGVLQKNMPWNAPDLENTRAIALGDMDGDGDLDLAAGRVGSDTIYRNRGSTIRPTLGWRSPMTDDTYSLAWGDMDNDGDLDLASGNGPERPNLLYRNHNRQLEQSGWTPTADRFTHSVAWGDVDGDGDLDLAVGNSGFPITTGDVNEVYLNHGTGLDNNAVWNSADQDSTRSVAWGDLDGDGDLDLAAGNDRAPNKVYLNQNGRLAEQAAWVSADSDRTTTVAWGDLDNDGDLDLAVSNIGAPSKVYLNQRGQLTATAVWHSTDVYDSQSLAWGDVNGDGYLDLAIGNAGQASKVFLNLRGQLQAVAAWSSADSYNARSVAWGDADGDGDLDLMIGNFNQPLKLYVNEAGMLQPLAAWSSSTGNTTRSVTWGDLDGDGDLDLAVGNRDNEVTNVSYNEIYLNQRAAYLGRSGPTIRPPSVAIQLTSDPVLTFNNQPSTALAPANFYATAAIRQARVIPLTYTLFHPTSEPVAKVRAYYSLDGNFSGPRDTWHVAVPTLDTRTTDLRTSPYPTSTVENTYTFAWDLWASGFFGQSDNVVVRIEAVPDYKPRPNRAPGLFQYPFVASQTLPFRVRGSQVRVVDHASAPVSNALVYRIPASQPDQSRLLGNEQQSFRTTQQGYLQGRGELSPNDRLLALQPVHTTPFYTLYHTNGQPTQVGVDSFAVTTSGVQTLTVTAANPLLLFDLTVSLEWQEGEETPFLSTLRRDLIESAKALYDWSNGQVTLGKITVFQGREQWDNAHIQILASNQVRPSANRGGIVTDTLILTHPDLTTTITATQGIVRIGPNWTRYGDNDPNFIYDWPRVLAHELGHYLLFLEDTYLGLDKPSQLLIPITTCGNTAMTDPYEEPGTEFRFHDDHWPTECGATLAELPDWELIRLAYPALHAPPPANSGPATMPFLFTTVTVISPPAATAARLSNPLIALGNAAPDLLNGRVYLRRPQQQLIDLGKYTGNELLVRGGQEGDELCIFATAAYACSELSNHQPANFITKPLWSPLIAVTPTSTKTLTIFVEGAAGSQVTATIYPDGASPQTVLLATGSAQQVTLDQPAVEALVDISAATGGERFITGYALGSGPGRLRSFDGPGRLRSFDGPVSSSDGGAILYPPLSMDKATFISLQLAATLPALPIGLVPIGRAYYVNPSAEIADYSGGSIAFQYLGRDVTRFQLPEAHLAVYRWNGTTWHCLQCAQQVRNQAQNIVSAPLEGPGLYLLAGYQLSLVGATMNPIGYPLAYALPVTKALAALEGFYTVIYHYDVNQPAQPWTAFGIDAPAWVNTLVELKPNHSYWLYVTETLRWSITDGATAATVTPMHPPAIFYGTVTPTTTFTPTVDMSVTAQLNGTQCGQTLTKLVEGQIVYAIDVQAADPLNPAGCGKAGAPITFTVAAHNVATVASWDNTKMQAVDLVVVEDPRHLPLPNQLYLPLIANK